MKIKILILIIILSLANLYGQAYKHFKYGISEGLSIDLTKDIVDDEFGYIWIATDNGLIKYNGLKFTSYLDGLPSPFVKSFLKLRTNKLLAVTDQGILSINSTHDTSTFSTLYPGGTKVTDTTLFYPKSVYEDTKGNLWVSEPKRVVRISNNKLTPFTLPNEYRSYNFLRSYSVVQDDKENIYVFGYLGGLLRFDETTQKFIDLHLPSTITQVSVVYSLKNNEFLVGTATGLFNVKISPDGKLVSTNLISNTGLDVSSIVAFKDGSFVLSTWSKGLYLLSLNGTKPNIVPFHSVNSNKINRVFYSKLHDLWVSADDGAILVKQTIFEPILGSTLSDYVQDLSFTNDGSIILSDGQQIFKINKGLNSAQQINITPSRTAYLLQARKANRGYWQADSKGVITLKENDGNVRTFVFPNSVLPILNICLDTKQNLWACQDNTIGVMKIDDKNKTRVYSYEQGFKSTVSVIRENRDNKLICAGNGIIYKYNTRLDRFETQAVIKDSTVTVQKLLINDIAFGGGDTIWAATTRGLYVVVDEVIQKVDLEEHSNLEIRAINIDKRGRLWLGTNIGIIKYDKDNLSLFDEADGLPARTISYRCIVIDKDDNIVVGTSRGLFVKSSEFTLRESPEPFLVSVNSQSKMSLGYLGPFSFNAGSVIELHYLCLTYPAGNVSYQYKVIERDSTWISQGHNTTIFITDLPSGKYQVQIRAKLHGNYEWGSPITVLIEVNPHWYSRLWFILLSIFAIIGIVSLAFRKYSEKLIKEKRKLEAIVSERTSEISLKNEALNKQKEEIEAKNKNLEDLLANLHQMNEEITKKNDILNFQKEEIEKKNISLESLLSELEELNATKDKFFSIISHDLKSPFTALLGFTDMLNTEYDEFTDDQRKQFLVNIHQSASLTYRLVENLLEWSRSQRNKLNLEFADYELNNLVFETTYLLQDSARAKSQEIINSVPSDLLVYADKATVSTVLRNLISNAVKFTPEGGVIEVTAEPTDEMVVISIRDNGIGIPQDRIARLFKVDQTFSTLGTNNERGTGLGLVVVREFIEKNNGKMSVESEEGKGTTFAFTLPLSKNIPELDS